MKILEKYTIKNFLWPFLYCLATFVFLYLIIDLFSRLDEVLRNKVPFPILLNYFASFIPVIFVQITPVAMLLACVYVFSTMNRHNEILAMKSSGINMFEIIKPFLMAGLAISLMVMLANEILVPHGSIAITKIRQNHLERISGQAKDTVIKDVAIYGENNRLFYVKEFNMARRKLNEVIILEHDSLNNLKTKIIAKSGRWENKKWVFSNCVIYNVDKDGELIGKPQVYDKKIMGLEETPKYFYMGQFQAELMNFSQLAEYVKKFYSIDKRIATRLAVDLYYKTSFPFISFIVVFLGVGFGLRTRKGGVFWGIGMSLVISFVYYGVMAICLALGKGGVLMPQIAAWGPNLLFLGVGTVLLAKLAN